MTEVNPFNALGAQFAQAPAAQPAPQPGFAPQPQAAPAAAPQQQFAPQAAPQQYAAPQTGYAPQAPAAPQQYTAPAAAPAPVASNAVYAATDAPSPTQVGAAAAFGTSYDGGGEKHKIRDDLGRPLLFRIHKSETRQGRPKPDGTPGDPYEAVFADWIVLDPAAPLVRERGMITNRPIVKDLKETLEKGLAFHVGRVKEVPSNFPQPALALGPLTEEEQQLAVQAGQAFGWF